MDSVVKASYFLERGFTVFPCKPDKSPICPSWKIFDTKECLSKSNTGLLDTWTCYGIAIPKGFMVVDCDLYKTDEAYSSYKHFISVSGPSLFCVETGSGGKHLWYTVDPNVKLKRTLPEYPGIDFLTIGAYVIGPGSVTEKGYYVYKSGDLPVIKED